MLFRSGFAVDLVAPTTTDDTATLGSGWFTTPQTVNFTAVDAGGSAVAATYYTTDGSTPTTSSASGSSVLLASSGTFTVRYFSVDGLGNAEAVRTATVAIRLDLEVPVTTDNTATLGAATKTTAQTVVLSPVDRGGSGLAATYYTTDGSDPTRTSPTGTSVVLAASGSYTVKYFSVDAAGNAEAIRTASTVITIDMGGPVTVITSPVDGASYNAAGYAALCSNTARICGTAADSSGVAKVTLTIKRVSDGKYFDGASTWGASKVLTATGTTSWYYAALTAKTITNGQSYVITVTATDKLNLPTVVASTFTYDTTAPAVASASVTNKNGRIEANVDTFTVNFKEAINPATVPTTATLTLVRKSSGTTTYAISGLTNGAQDRKSTRLNSSH